VTLNTIHNAVHFDVNLKLYLPCLSEKHALELTKVQKPTPHPETTLIKASQSPPTLYYLESFPMEKECPYPHSDGFRCH
jgi:hypothetical protein